MRILIAHTFYRVGGGEDQYVRQEQAMLEAAGDDVLLLERRNEELENDLRTATTMLYSRTMRRDVEKSIREFEPDVIHVHNIYPGLGPAIHLAASRLKIPLAMTVHNYRLRCPNGYMFTQGEVCRRCLPGNTANAVIHRCFPTRGQSTAYAVGIFMHRFALGLDSRIDRFICPSRFVMEELGRWGIPEERCVVVRNFSSLAPTQTEEPTYGIYVGRLSAEKGLDVLVESLAIAKDPEFLIVGEGPQKDELESLARDRGLQNVRFVGRLERSDIPVAYASARYAVFPSLWHENAPIAALEAMSFGIPLVVTSMGGLPELVAGGAGYVVPPNDAQALGQRLAALSMNPPSEPLRERARAFVQAEASAERHVSQLRHALQGTSRLASPKP